MPDATGLELIAQELAGQPPAPTSPVLDTLYFRDRGTLLVKPESIRSVLSHLRGRGYGFMSSVHGVDHYPHEPRLGVVYELLDMASVDRITVKVRVSTEDPHVDSVTPEWPTADHQEREVYDMFGVIFAGTPTCAGS